MTHKILQTCTTLFLLLIGTTSFSQSYWTSIASVPEGEVLDDNREKAEKYSTFELDREALDQILAQAPHEKHVMPEVSPSTIHIPMPDGSVEKFRYVAYDAVNPSALTKFPRLIAYRGVNPESGSTVRFDHGYNGFNAIITEGEKTIIVDRYFDHNKKYYTSYYLSDLKGSDGASVQGIRCELDSETSEDFIKNNPVDPELQQRIPTFPLKIYRTAITTTGEWSNTRGGGTISGTMSAIMTVINQLNEVMERDFTIRLELIGNNEENIYLNAADDPFQNGNAADLQSKATGVINNNVGAQAYDIGHAFGTNTGGLAALGSVCQSNKGAGSSSTFGQYAGSRFFHIVAHEMGHQLTATHTFNWCDNMNETSSTGYEPGSGSTLMSYAGASDCENRYIQNVSDPYFHVNSIERALQFSRDGGGNSCGSSLEHDNTAPEVILDYEDGFFIPISTPFQLDGDHVDAQNDEVTYCWEQYDLGPLSPLGSPIGNAPIFRSFPPTTDSFRVFPRWQQIFFGAADLTEVLPTYSRDLTFRVTVRDNNSVAGLVNWQEIAFKATASAGPFRVLSPTLGDVLESGDFFRVVWDVANTDGPLVDCQAVDIYMSTSGSNFERLLAAGVPNTGSYFLEVPAEEIINARLMVKAADNIFFNVTDRFDIEQAEEPGIGFAPVITESQICLPETREFELRTAAKLDYDGEVNMEIISDIPAGLVAAFEQQTVQVGESNTLSLDFTDFTEEEVIDIVVRAIAPGVDTVDQIIQLTTVSNDFSSISPMLPANGDEGLSTLPDFTWMGSENANSYKFELATNPSFEEEFIVESINGLSSTDYQPSATLDENTLYFWRIVGENECGEGQASDIYSFYTINLSCVEFESDDTPINISSGGTPTIVSRIPVPNGSNITDINVTRVNIDHDNVGQLTLTLIAPDGEEVILVDQKCSFQTDLDRGYDDESAEPFSCNTTDQKLHKPQDELSVLNGEDADGLWSLEVDDNTIGSGGELRSWSFEVCANILLDPPVLEINDTLLTDREARTAISDEELRTVDNNNSDEEITYIVSSLTRYGIIEREGVPMEVGDSFTQADINARLVTYEHQDTSQSLDQFDFVVVDGEGGFIGANTFNIKIDLNSATSSIPFVENIIEIFPNPAKDRVFIKVQDAQTDLRLIELRNAQGQLLMVDRNPVGNEVLSLSVQGVPSGLYFLTIYAEKGRETVKLVIQ